MLYETLRGTVLRGPLSAPTEYLLVGVVAVALTYAFSEVVFGIVERLERQSLARSREVAALSAMMQERERLSRELHDGLAQLVAYLLVRIDTVTGLVTSDRRSEAVAELERLRGVADDLYADVRESIWGLRTRVSERGLLPAVQDYLEEFEERHEIVVSLKAEQIPQHLPPLVEFQFLRIVQEALANVRKHSGAERAWVELRCVQPDMLRMEIRDNGKGFDPQAGSGPNGRSYGLATMRERTASVGGTFTVESSPGAGTRVVAQAPLGETGLEVHDGRSALAAG